MDPRVLLSQYGPAVAAGLAVVLLLWLLLRSRRRPARNTAPPVGGRALALVLEGDLPGAQRLLENAIRLGGTGSADAWVGFIAVLRAKGEAARALALLGALARRGGGAWVGALRVRVALESGQLEQALAAVEANELLPLDLTLATLARCGRFQSASDAYVRHVPKKERQAAQLAALLAGCAAEQARGGARRASQKPLKKALGLDPHGLIPLAVASRIHPKSAERVRCARIVAERVPGWLGTGRSEDPQGASPLAGARRMYAGGQTEAALGHLRDYLDLNPQDWAVRRQYGEWLLEAGGGDRVGGELADLLAHLPNEAPGMSAVARCGSCGVRAEAPFFVCPRCHSWGTARPEEGGLVDGLATPSLAGARWADLLLDLAPKPPEAAG